MGGSTYVEKLAGPEPEWSLLESLWPLRYRFHWRNVFQKLFGIAGPRIFPGASRYMNSESSKAIIRPVPATIGVVFHEGKVLLVRRANPPDVGKWGFPGGKIEWGESLKRAAEREVLEETGVTVAASHAFTAVDCFDVRKEGRLQQHFVLIAVLCRWLSGEPVAADDALEARWFTSDELETGDLVLSLDVPEVIRLGLDALPEG